MSFDEFISIVQDLLEHITSRNKLCLISGHFNINLLDADHNHSQEFIDILFAYSCVPLINKPTRITSTSATTRYASISLNRVLKIGLRSTALRRKRMLIPPQFWRRPVKLVPSIPSAKYTPRDYVLSNQIV